MGFFSATCKSDNCDASLLSMAATGPGQGETYEHDNSWMARAVAVTPNGSVIKGEYDGYGRVGAHDLYDSGESFDDTDFWHEACWEVAGSPTANRGGSDHAADQGWFFGSDDQERYDRPDPRTTSPA